MPDFVRAITETCHSVNEKYQIICILRTRNMFFISVLGAIAVCLFPLWPPEVRLGVYYLSLAAAGFVGFILSLCVSKYIKIKHFI